MDTFSVEERRRRLIGCWPPRSGAAAIECLAQGRHGVLVGLTDGQIRETPLAAAATGKKSLEPKLLALASVLAQ